MQSNKIAANGNFYKENGEIANFAETMNEYGSIKSIDSFDQLAIESKTFVSGHRFESVANDANVYTHFKAGDKKTVLIYSVGPTGKCYYGMYFTPTITDDGTEIYTAIRNQSEPIPATSVFYHTPTYSDIGILSVPRMIPASDSPSQRGGTTKTEQFVILSPNADVIIYAQNKAGAVADIEIVVDWAEIG